jgi:long-chain acyl-CoA synthetase
MKVEVLPDLLYEAIPHHKKSDCLMFKKDGVWRNISHTEVVETVESLAARLIELGLKKGDRVGLLSENRPEWAYADLAVLCAGGITVPIYSSLPAKQIEYIINNSEMVMIFVSTENQLNKILEIRSDVPQVRTIFVFDPPAALPQDVSGLATVIAEGRQPLARDPKMVRNRAAELRPDDVFSIIYTSGTTGEPKGVVLSHDNIISNIKATIDVIPTTTNDIALSFLPLSHVFERMAGYYALLYRGCTIAYAESIEMMPRNLPEVRPTVLFSVPRVYEKFYARIMDNVASEHGLKKKTALWALKVAAELADLELNKRPVSFSLRLRYILADALVLKKIRNRLGGRLRLMLSGGAALPRQLGVFFYGLGLKILEGYGLTETSPVIAANREDACKFGTVGRPIPGIEVKIAEDGEILTRGPHVMKGYYKLPKETAQAITEGGWFHTGDIGEIDAEGFLRITDRKKDLIVTSGGKKVAPQFVENTLKTCKYISQIVVVGDKRKYPSALIAPSMDHLKKLAAEKQVPESEMLKSRIILDEIQDEINRLSQDLAPFERVKKIALLEHEFTIESGEMTPSLKIKRNVVEKKYKDLIDSLYSV